MNNKFIIQKKYKQNSVGILKYNRVTNQKIYEKVNVTILAKNVNSYKIKIEKDYKKYNLFKGDLYMVDYNLLKKCTDNVWNNLLNINKEEDLSSSDDIYENNNVISEDELEFIKDNINPLTSSGEGVTVFTSPYLSAGAPALGEAKGLIIIKSIINIILNVPYLFYLI